MASSSFQCLQLQQPGLDLILGNDLGGGKVSPSSWDHHGSN